jgi:uncharacterized membrane protein YeaQ/YmgE (transglycosylase-associated protein family)
MFGLLLLVAIGLMAGWLANMFTRGGGLGTAGNVIAGIAGSLVGGLLFQQFGARLVGEHGALFISFGVALATAVVFLVVAGLIKK